MILYNCDISSCVDDPTGCTECNEGFFLIDGVCTGKIFKADMNYVFKGDAKVRSTSICNTHQYTESPGVELFRLR